VKSRADVVLILSPLVFLVMLVLVETGASIDLDRTVMTAFGAAHNDVLTTLARAVTYLGGGSGAVILGVGIVGWLLGRGERRAALHVVGTLVLGAVLGIAIKLAVGRGRPDVFEWLAEPLGSSFPSGHSASVALGLPLVAWVVAERTRPRLVIEVLAWLLVVLVGLSRCYLGVHWPTDVIAGWAIGIGLWRLSMRLAPAPLAGPTEPTRDAEREPTHAP